MIVDLILQDARAYVNKEITECHIAIDNGKIFQIGKNARMPKAQTKVSLRELFVLPGLIDVHVHLRGERKAYKEDFYSGTAAAAAGGITTVLDMPNNDPVTMSAETLKNRINKAKNEILVNVGFYSEFPKRTEDIEDIAREGAVAFKLYMARQIGGLDINDNRALTEAFEEMSKLKLTVAAHAEDRTTIEKVETESKRSKHNNIEAFLKAHSINAEVKAVSRLLKIVKQTKTKLHFCHVSTEHALEAIIDGKESGLPLTCEVTPHHMFLSSEDLRRIGTLALTMPPFRRKYNVEALWNGIRKDWVDIFASDHAPHSLDEKTAEDVWNVKVGIPGLETTLPLLLTEVKHGRLSIADIVKLMAEKPAEIFGLKGKGCLKEGNAADLTIVDLNRKYKFDASKFHTKANFSPFDGWAVEGTPVKTMVNGQLVMDYGKIVAKAGSGEIVRRG